MSIAVPAVMLTTPLKVTKFLKVAEVIYDSTKRSRIKGILKHLRTPLHGTTLLRYFIIIRIITITNLNKYY